MMADMAFLGSVGGVDVDYGDTGFSCLIVYELSELIESPRKMLAPLRHLNRSPLPDSLKIFESNNGRSVYSLRNHLFRDAVVSITPESGFAFANLLKMSFGTWCVTALQICLNIINLDPGLFDTIPGENFAGRVNCNILDTKIDTKNRCSINGGCFRRIDHNSQIEGIIPENQIDLASWPIHPIGIVIADPNRHNESTIQGKQGNAIKSFPRHDTLIIGHCSIKVKLNLYRLISFIGFNRLGNCPDCHLSRQVILLSDAIVDRLLQLDFVSKPQLERSFGNVIASRIELMHSLVERQSLLRGCFNLNHKSLHHRIEDIAL